MKHIVAALLFAIFSISCSNTYTNADDFNQDWQFRLGELDSDLFEDSNINEDRWTNVTIPHDWSIENGYTQEQTSGSNAFLPGGIGWYRKSFDVNNEMLEKNIYVRFEGVYNNSQVWINGVDLGFYPNGYLDFEYDLTPHLRKGKNTITVRVDRQAFADARWYVGAGIYRPVHLIVRNDCYIPTHGQLISTADVTAQSAMVNIATDVTNTSSSDKSYIIKYEVADGETIIADGVSNVEVASGKTITSYNTMSISNPKLWSLETPNIYTLKTTILGAGSQEICHTEESFGVRTIEFNPERGFLLNGKVEKIKGVNLHHDLGCVGVALYDDILYRRLRALKSVGVNAIRTAHNPHSESLVKMCDTMGLVVMNEIFDEWRVAKGKIIISRDTPSPIDESQIGYSAHFDEWAERDVKSFVRRDFNSPSVVMWSIGNEIEWTYEYYAGASLDKRGYKGLIFTGEYDVDPQKTKARFDKLSGGDDELSKTAHELATWIKQVDTSRPVTSGVVVPSVSHVSGYTDALDVVGYNYKHTYYEPHHKMYPDKPIIGSENVGQYYEWKAVVDKPYIPGIFLWTGVDYLGENGPWPAKGGTYSLFDFATFKTPRGHFFEILWCDVPKTYMVTTPAAKSEFKLQNDGSFKSEWDTSQGFIRRWLWFECYEKWGYTNGEPIVVQVYTNAPKAELILNGESLGVKSRSDFSDENILLWQVPYAAGELTAIGRNESGEELSRYQLKTAGETAQLVAFADQERVASDGSQVVNIELELQDSNGTRITDRDEEINVEVGIKLRIVGIDNGSDKFVGDHQSDKIMTNNGRALIVVQPKYGESGIVDIKISTLNNVSTTVKVKVD